MLVSGKISITDTTLRDANQYLLSTRLETKDMLPIAEKMDQAGFGSIEIWGGGTFDACIRVLKEDPWERLRKLREAFTNSKLQMLLRARNLVGYKPYPNNIIAKFVKKAQENGIDIFRIYDALNDVKNLEFPIKVAKKEGAVVQAGICYTLSPYHSQETFITTSKALEEIGADSICIKDIGSLLAPHDAFLLVKKLKEELSVPIQLHAHCTSGMAIGTYVKAIEAGIDALDTAISPLSMGTSQPPTETLVHILKNMRKDSDLNEKLLREIATYFSKLKSEYTSFESPFSGIDPEVLTYQIPPSMIINLTHRLQEEYASTRIEEVLLEVPKVRADLGYPALISPASQLVGTQAALNIAMGKRYKIIPKDMREYIKGKYGNPPGPIDTELRKRIDAESKHLLEQEEEKSFEELEKELGDLATCEEDVLTYALFSDVGFEFLHQKMKTIEFGDDPRYISAAIVAAMNFLVAEKASKRELVVRREHAESQFKLSPWKIASRMRNLR